VGDVVVVQVREALHELHSDMSRLFLREVTQFSRHIEQSEFLHSLQLDGEMSPGSHEGWKEQRGKREEE
jgi:hypothetical protein